MGVLKILKGRGNGKKIVYRLFFLIMLVLMLIVAITESKPTNAISPIGVSVGTTSPSGGGIRALQGSPQTYEQSFIVDSVCVAVTSCSRRR